MSRVVTRESIDLLTSKERREIGTSLLGVNLLKLMHDLQNRIDAFASLLEHEREVADKKGRPEYFANCVERVGDFLAENIKMHESLLKQQILIAKYLKEQSDLEFALGIMEREGYKPIPDYVYSLHREQLDKDCAEHWELTEAQ
jgi:hypothetical protein